MRLLVLKVSAFSGRRIAGEVIEVIVNVIAVVAVVLDVDVVERRSVFDVVFNEEIVLADFVARDHVLTLQNGLRLGLVLVLLVVVVPLSIAARITVVAVGILKV